MHTYTYTQEVGGKKMLKNTKINYTKDLLHHCLLIFWEDYASFFLCVLQSLSPSKVSSISFVDLFYFVSTSKWRPPVLILGVKSAQWWHYQETGVQNDDCTGLDLDGAKLLEAKKTKKKTKAKQSKIMMSSFIEDKCFICFHTDLFLLLSSQCLHSIFSTLYILSCSLSLHPPQILTQKNKTKNIGLAPSLWKM